jgi:hypothetical protein
VERKETERDRERKEKSNNPPHHLLTQNNWPRLPPVFMGQLCILLLPPPPAANSLLFFVLLQGTPDSSKHWPFVFSIVRFACTLVLLLFVDFVGPFFHLLL